MTLLEVIGVLGVIALLAGAALPVAIRLLDGIVARKEVATLRSLAGALETSILNRHIIPPEAAVPSFIASFAGMDPLSVTKNARNRTRLFVVDKGSGWFSTNLPYSQLQNARGTPTIPDRPRIMLISSLGPELGFSASDMDKDAFEALWNTPEGMLPDAAPWKTSYSGRAEDVKVHRINLAPLFVRVALSTYQSATNGHFAIGAGPPTNAVPQLTSTTGFYLRGTELGLYTGVPFTNLNHTVILNNDVSFVYENGMWKDGVVNAGEVGVIDLAAIVKAFLAAQPNPNAWDNTNNNQQVAVVTTMIRYLSNYTAWSDPSNHSPSDKVWNSPNDKIWRSLLATKRGEMMDAVQGLYCDIAGWTNYPPEIPCP